MFENLRSAFRDAVRNFKDELDRDDVPEAVDRLLKGMVDEVTDAKAYASKLEGEIEQTGLKVKREKDAAATALRRAQMAAKIGDVETETIATEFARKHAAALAVQEQKLEALREEHTMKSADVVDMLAKVKAARTDRERLVATAGRAGSRRTLTESDELFAQMDRMAEKIEGTQSQADAAREFSDYSEGTERRPPEELEQSFRELEDDPPLTVDERLAALKRKMQGD